tara:strand:+ start:495 stop:659 length:165 start_codon:yes stop_codon:yes gene_type:complete
MAVLDLTQSNFDETIANNEIVIMISGLHGAGHACNLPQPLKKLQKKLMVSPLLK